MENIGYGKIVCLCGSSKFKDIFKQEERRLTLQGYIVLSLAIFVHADNEELTDEQIQMSIINHKKKIRMCDMVYVIDVDNYIGDCTQNEIKYAKSINKEIHYYNNKYNNMYESQYPVNDMMKKKTWNEFLDTGLLLQANQILHNFGYAITVSLDGENNVVEVYPARVKFRGFSEKAIDKSYTKVAQYLKENMNDLVKEVED